MFSHLWLNKSACLPVLLGLFAGQASAYANEPPYTSATARAYLESKPNVVVVLRTDGGVSPGTFAALLKEFGAEQGDGAIRGRRWEEDVDVYPQHRLVILKTLKGALAGHVMVPSRTPEIYRIPLGQPVLVFLDSEVEIISTCDVFEPELFPSEVLASGSLSDVVDVIVKKGLSCAGMEP